MRQETQNEIQRVPSKRELASATGVALVIALLLLFTAILPAEYGIDPFGTGRALGLTRLVSPEPPPESAAMGNTAKLEPVQEGPVAHYNGEYMFDSVEFTLGPYEYVEYKYRLEKGAAMQYAWHATTNLLQDFHGERDGGEANSEESFDKQERRQAFGALVAPFSGIHGWYWENPGGETVTIKLKTSGFYTAAVEIRSDRTRHNREVTPLEKVNLAQSPLQSAPATR